MPDHYRWTCPDGGPAARPADLAAWAIAALATAPGAILCAGRDLPALRATLLADRVALPEHGIVQPGTIWIEEAC